MDDNLSIIPCPKGRQAFDIQQVKPADTKIRVVPGVEGLFEYWQMKGLDL